jgi:hypothetical protein
MGLPVLVPYGDTDQVLPFALSLSKGISNYLNCRVWAVHMVRQAHHERT